MNKTIKPANGGALAVFLLIVSAFPAAAAPRAELWPRWTAHDSASTLRVDHSGWDAFLSKHILPGSDGSASKVAYAAVGSSDKIALGEYIQSLEAVPVSSLDRKEQMAFWINLYNAATVKLILDHYPIKSIKDIKVGGLFGKGPWDTPVARIENEDLTLNDIEHRILRPIWKDPRIHYAVNCASLGCPDLRERAFTADNTEALLEKGARDYINSPRGAAFEGGRLVLSSIYTWFEEDFGSGRDGVTAHLLKYARPDLASRLKGYTGRIRYEYDWNLNEP